MWYQNESMAVGSKWTDTLGEKKAFGPPVNNQQQMNGEDPSNGGVPNVT